MENKTIITAALLTLLLVVALISCAQYAIVSKQLKYELSKPAPQIEANKAILDVTPYDFYINIEDNNEMIYNFWVYNFGDVEASNVVIECMLIDEEGYEYNVYSENIGKIPSHSESFEEVYTIDRNTNDYDYYAQGCRVVSGDNAVILSDLIDDESY